MSQPLHSSDNAALINQFDITLKKAISWHFVKIVFLALNQTYKIPAVWVIIHSGFIYQVYTAQVWISFLALQLFSKK